MVFYPEMQLDSDNVKCIIFQTPTPVLQLYSIFQLQATQLYYNHAVIAIIWKIIVLGIRDFLFVRCGCIMDGFKRGNASNMFQYNRSVKRKHYTNKIFQKIFKASIHIFINQQFFYLFLFRKLSTCSRFTFFQKVLVFKFLFSQELNI